MSPQNVVPDPDKKGGTEGSTHAAKHASLGSGCTSMHAPLAKDFSCKLQPRMSITTSQKPSFRNSGQEIFSDTIMYNQADLLGVV